LHELALKFATDLLSSPPPVPVELDAHVQAWIYGKLAFVENSDKSAHSVQIAGAGEVDIPAAGISVVDVSALEVLWASGVVRVERMTPPQEPLPLKLRWSEWWADADVGGWWRRAAFDRTEPGLGSQRPLLVNVTGLYVGNLFVNGHHVATFSTFPGNCTGGAGECNSFLPESCGRPTQDAYQVPEEFLSKTSENELLIFNCGLRSGHTCSLPAGASPPSVESVYLATRQQPSIPPEAAETKQEQLVV